MRFLFRETTRPILDHACSGRYGKLPATKHRQGLVVGGPWIRKDYVKQDRLEYFRGLLLTQLRQLTEQIRTDQAAALELYDDGVKDSVDLSVSDLNKEIALRLGERGSQLVADIDQALLRMKEGSYGVCSGCGHPIDERRLEAIPTARYDAQCQAAIESANGDDDLPTL